VARLPIYEIQERLIAALGEGRRLILSAPTGSGKSTQVPQMLLDSGVLGSGQVVVLQPRRLATRLLAMRVAAERKSAIGAEVGYQIRFDNVTSPATRIRFVTEGILLRQMTQEPELSGVSAIIFDEFHERHLHGDITLALALDVQAGARPDLKIVVMSATLDVEALEVFLKPCPVLETHGRSYPVEIEYARTATYLEKRPIWEQAAEALRRWIASGGEGDVLIFMPGAFEIGQTIAAIRQAEQGLFVLPLHGELGTSEQDAAVARYPKRKVVVATNVAETSLTIEGVRCVIDSGLARVARHDPYRGINTLLVEKISRASAEQRAGRAGRTAPGVCVRLWAEEEHGHRALQETPEVKRLELSEVVLTLKASGVEDLRGFRWLEAPTEQALAHAEELLVDLGALAPGPQLGAETSSRKRVSGSITPVGRKMMAFPVHPRYSRMLLAAQDYGCVHDACLLAALTQGRELLLRSNDREVARHRSEALGEETLSDFFTLRRAQAYASRHDADACRRVGIHAGTARQVAPLFEHFLNIARREGLDTAPRPSDEKNLRRCILIGFSDRVCRRLDRGTLRCEMVHGRKGMLARESVVQTNELFVAAEVREVEKKDKEVSTILALATAIEEGWLRELFPEDLTRTVRVNYDSEAKRVYAQEEICFRELAISMRNVEPPPLERAAQVLANEVMAGRLKLSEWTEDVEQWITRLNRLAQWCPELQLPTIGTQERADLVEQLCHGEFSYKSIKDKPVWPVVKSWLNAGQQELLDKHAPERLRLGNGRNTKLHYEAAGSPYIALRIQELFGVNTTPRIAMGRVPMVVHILAPSRRPVQITQDLAGFWRDHYPRVKQELQRKYPKHEWR
jgi:ATP-dependent helicase HrpB